MTMKEGAPQPPTEWMRLGLGESLHHRSAPAAKAKAAAAAAAGSQRPSTS